MLRVISGKYKSRKLKEVKTDSTRPTTDKNKEALFNTLGQYFMGGRVLDLFAGSGALGIEALSRGFDYVEFVENNIQAVSIIRDNLKSLNIGSDEAKVYKQDAFSYLAKTKLRFDLILVDPPYKLGKYEDILKLVSSRQLLDSDGIIVLESDKDLVLPDIVEDLVKLKEKSLGNSKFTLFLERKLIR
jgi:16S rRNA (guanine(966)-N(2))-methyltransferase RsmD